MRYLLLIITTFSVLFASTSLQAESVGDCECTWTDYNDFDKNETFSYYGVCLNTDECLRHCNQHFDRTEYNRLNGSVSFFVARDENCIEETRQHFGSDWEALAYVASYPDLLVSRIGVDPIAADTYFRETGQALGHTVSFLPLNYIASHNDLIGRYGVDRYKGARHYIQNGYEEGREITFNGYVYIAGHIDLINRYGFDTERGAQHFIEHGFSEGRKHDRFCWQVYMQQNNDVRRAFHEDDKGLSEASFAARHYIIYGIDENRDRPLC